MANREDGNLGPDDLWAKYEDRIQHHRDRSQSPEARELLREANRRSAKSRRFRDEMRNLMDLCIVCDEVVSEDFWDRTPVYLCKRTSVNASGQGAELKSSALVSIHEACVKDGIEIAAAQGYALRVGGDGRF